MTLRGKFMYNFEVEEYNLVFGRDQYEEKKEVIKGVVKEWMKAETWYTENV